MIENRLRIEKQILLGRQVVHRAYKNKLRSAHEPRQLLVQKSLPGVPEGSKRPSISASPPPSGSDLPLSVDTDAEAAFARGSRFYRRGRESRNPSPHGNFTPDVNIFTGYVRRRQRSQDPPEIIVNEVDTDRVDDPSSSRSPTSEAPQPSFFSRLRNNSIPKLSLSPFTLEHTLTTPRRDSSADVPPESNWSSESSSDDDYPSHE